MTDTALQTINFNFYGDDLIALRDNATGEIYIAINSALKGIVFANRQAKHIHNKWTDDLVISKVGIQNFVLHSNGGMQDTLCISLRKISLALAKINIISNMRKTQPELTSKLELYQDKCADVLASIFIDKKSTVQNTQSLIDSFNTFTQTINDTLLSMNERIMNLEKTQAELEKLPKNSHIGHPRCFQSTNYSWSILVSKRMAICTGNYIGNLKIYILIYQSTK